MAPPLIQVIGGGPAGSSAALTALQLGARVTVWEKSRFPRHKVCGEFLSPGVVPLLRSLDLEADFFHCRPAPIRRMLLCMGKKAKHAPLPETAWGLSRYCVDNLLLDAAVQRGAALVRERAREEAGGDGAVVLAAGRRAPHAPRGERLFGFKAHYDGPAEDAVELYFFSRCYIGISPVEGGRTNVCGLGPESDLAQFGFHIDEMLHSVQAVRERLAPLRRIMDWLTAGPLVFANRFRSGDLPATLYPAGDALSFVDPFTGSGMLSAILSGSLAGRAAARGVPVEVYLGQCRDQLHRPFQAAQLFRRLITRGWAEHLLACVPGSLLFRVTRP